MVDARRDKHSEPILFIRASNHSTTGPALTVTVFGQDVTKEKGNVSEGMGAVKESSGLMQAESDLLG